MQLHNLIDPGQLWSPHYGTLPLPDKQSYRCKHCFSLSYQSARCELFPEPLLKTYQNTQHCLICFCWNKTTRPSCPYLNCRFMYICYICTHNQAITNVSHKAIHCPQQGSQQPIRPLLPSQSTPVTSTATHIRQYNRLGPITCIVTIVAYYVHLAENYVNLFFISLVLLYDA